MDVLIAVAVLGILGSIAVVNLGGLTQTVKEDKLQSDVRTLNRAVKVYLASGGSLSDAETAEEVIAALRSRVDSSKVNQSPGLTSSLIDYRISIQRQGDNDVASKDARAYWNSSKLQFEVATSGDTPGIAEFYIDEKAVAANKGTQDRKFAVSYSENSDWIWDYADEPASEAPGPTIIALSSAAPTNTTAPSVTPPSGSPSGTPSATPSPTSTLLPPSLSLPGGAIPFETSIFS